MRVEDNLRILIINDKMKAIESIRAYAVGCSCSTTENASEDNKSVKAEYGYH